MSRLEPGQYTPGNHYANQVNIWGGLGQLSLDMLDDRPVVASLEYDPEGCEEQPDILGSLYDETQQWIMENYPDSYAAQTYIAAAEELVNGTDAQSGENGYYTYIYNPPAGYAWQVVALVGEEIAGGTEIPDVPSVPEPKYYSAAWTAPAQSASGSFDLTFTVNTDKYQLNTLEKVDGAVITVTPSRTGGNVDGGSWQMSPAGAQTITTSGHTPDDNFHLNGGDGSATWTVHYEVSKTSTSTLSGQEGPFASQAEADAAAEAAKNAAIGQLQNEAQGMVDAAIAAARAQLANITFSYDEVTIPHGFDATPGALGSHQTITVPANSSNDYKMQNDEWSVKVSIDKIDSETKQRIKGNAETINCFSTAIPLFYNAKKQALSRYGVTYILKKYAAKASPVLEPQNISPHVLRHTKAMHLLRAGVNMIYIRDFLGHADISTTEVYARIDAEMKRKVFEEKVPNYTPNTTMPWEEDEDLLQWLTQFGKKTF